MAIGQPMYQVPSILRQISGSIEEVINNALTSNQHHHPSLPHTPQVHPQPSQEHVPQELFPGSRPHLIRNKEEKSDDENNKLMNVDEDDDHRGPLPRPRPTVTTSPSGGRERTTNFGPWLDSPVTVAPTPYFNSTMTNYQHNHNHKVVPFVVSERVDNRLLPIGTQPQPTYVVQSTVAAQEDGSSPSMPEPRRLPFGGSPTVAIYHHRNRSDTMTPLI